MSLRDQNYFLSEPGWCQGTADAFEVRSQWVEFDRSQSRPAGWAHSQSFQWAPGYWTCPQTGPEKGHNGSQIHCQKHHGGEGSPHVSVSCFKYVEVWFFDNHCQLGLMYFKFDFAWAKSWGWLPKLPVHRQSGFFERIFSLYPLGAGSRLNQFDHGQLPSPSQPLCNELQWIRISWDSGPLVGGPPTMVIVKCIFRLSERIATTKKSLQ